LQVEIGLRFSRWSATICDHTGISGNVWRCLAVGVNIRAIAQGSIGETFPPSSKPKTWRKAVNKAIRRIFSGREAQINLFVVGVGTVGSRLLLQLASTGR